MGEFAGVDEAIAKQQKMSGAGEFDGAVSSKKARLNLDQYGGAMKDVVAGSSPTAGGIDIGNISFGPL